MDTRFTWQDAVLIGLLVVVAVAAAASVSWFIFERIPHLEDELTYLFQARTYARGALWAPAFTPQSPFFVPFVISLGGRRFGKYPPGWPALLAIGEIAGAGWLVNPILGGLAVALTYFLARRLFDREIGALAGALMISSPMFLILSGSLMAHAAALFWMTLFAYSLLRADEIYLARMAGERSRRPWGWASLAGLGLGMAMLTRSLSAVGVALPFVVWLAIRALREPRQNALEVLATFWPTALVAILLSLLYPAYVYALTGDPTTNLYTLVWPYDRLGFGPGTGPHAGHTLRQAWINARADLRLWLSDLFGWPWASWVPLIPGLVAGLRQGKASLRHWNGLLLAPFVALVVIHMAYWVGAQIYGPRYYYEALPGLCILAALGLRWAVRLVFRARPRLIRWALAALVAALVAVNGALYLPERLGSLYGLYTITRGPIDELEELRQGRDVLVVVRAKRWIYYGELISLNSPWLDGPIVVAREQSPMLTARVLAMFPERDVLYYYDGEFSTEPPPPFGE
jgi:4-amino-4-deoxy-L-arabinose transferase-like glycosyltransferase